MRYRRIPVRDLEYAVIAYYSSTLADTVFRVRFSASFGTTASVCDALYARHVASEKRSRLISTLEEAVAGPREIRLFLSFRASFRFWRRRPRV